MIDLNLLMIASQNHYTLKIITVYFGVGVGVELGFAGVGEIVGETLLVGVTSFVGVTDTLILGEGEATLTEVGASVGDFFIFGVADGVEVGVVSPGVGV